MYFLKYLRGTVDTAKAAKQPLPPQP